MNCHDIIERLGEHLDRVLPPAEAAEVERHLGSCASCSAELAELRRTIEAVKALPRVRAPRGFAAGVMAEIRAEGVVHTAEPARVTPIRSFTVFMRLAASLAAVCLVWVGVRAIHVDQSVAPRTGATAKLQPQARDERHEEYSGFKTASKVGPAESAGKSADSELALLKERKASANGLPAPAAPKDASGPPSLGASAEPQKGAWGGKPEESAQALAVQRITVYSKSVAVDTAQLKKLLSDSGYTYSSQKKAILVRVPAREASRLVASLGSMPGGFRAADRQSLEALDRLKAAEELAAKADKGANAGDSEGGLTADADDLKEALRKHIDESRREIQKQEADKKAKAPASDPSAPATAAAAGGGEAGKPRRDAGAAKGGATGKDDGALAAGDSNEEAEGKRAGAGNAPAGPEVAGGRGPEEFEKKKAQKENEKDGGSLADKGKEHGDAKSEEGGSDDVNGRARREKDLGEKLSDELKKLEAVRKTADAEDAVVIYIEFEESADDAKPAAK